MNPALVSRRTYIMHHGEKVDVTDGIPQFILDEFGDDLQNLSGFIVEELWDTKHPQCPFAYLPKSDTK